VSPTPRRYQFDNTTPSFELRPLPARRPVDGFAEPRIPGDQAFPVRPEDAVLPTVVHQHIHQAPPDRTVQRLALGAGMGAGAVAAAVYFGPLLVASLWSIAIVFAAGGLVLAVIVRAITAILGAEKPRGRRRR
jgi:hypothetical protein